MTAVTERQINPASPPLDEKGNVPSLIINESMRVYSGDTGRRIQRETLFNILEGDGYREEQILTTFLKHGYNNKRQFGHAASNAFLAAQRSGKELRWQRPHLSQETNGTSASASRSPKITNDGIVDETVLLNAMTRLARGKKNRGKGSSLSYGSIRSCLINTHGYPRSAVEKTLRVYEDRWVHLKSTAARRAREKKGRRKKPVIRDLSTPPRHRIPREPGWISPERLKELAPPREAHLVYSKTSGDSNITDNPPPSTVDRKTASPAPAEVIFVSTEEAQSEKQTVIIEKVPPQSQIAAIITFPDEKPIELEAIELYMLKKLQAADKPLTPEGLIKGGMTTKHVGKVMRTLRDKVNREGEPPLIIKRKAGSKNTSAYRLNEEKYSLKFAEPAISR